MEPTRYDMEGIERRMTKYYEDLMNEVYFRYHYHPTHLKPYHPTPEQEAIDVEMTGLGNWAAMGCPMK